MPIVARLVDVTGHDADLAGARRDDSRTIRTDQPGCRAGQHGLDTQHVEHRNTFGDTDDDPDAGCRGFQDRIGREGRRYVDHAGVGPGLRHGIAHGIENRQSQVRLATLAGRHAADQTGTVGKRLRGVEGTLRPGKTLADHPGVFVDQDAHGSAHSVTPVEPRPPLSGPPRSGHRRSERQDRNAKSAQALRRRWCLPVAPRRERSPRLH